MEMSKTILTDECISVGSALYGSLLKGCFPIKNFRGIYHLNHYSILYSINNGPINEFIDDHYQIPEFKSLNFDEEYFNEILKNAKENAPSTESESEDEEHN
jgi:hypothetical protein